MTMYNNFVLESLGTELTGYEWPVNNPKAAVYLIHGIGEHAGRYDRVAEFFNDAGISLIAMDLRGHGRSPGKRGHIGDRAVVRKDIDNLIEYVKQKNPDVPLIHYGHSLGGNISLEYRMRGTRSSEPAGYLVTSPWIKLVQPVPHILYSMVKIGDKFIPEVTIDQNIKSQMLGNMNLIKSERDAELKHQRISLHTAVEGFDIADELINNKVADMFGGGEKPLLLMHGSNDPICDVDGSRIIAQNYGSLCEYVEWKDYLHELHNGTSVKPYEPVLEKMVGWIIATIS